MHIQTLSLGEVDEVEFDRADFLLVLHLIVEPLMMTARI